MPMITASDKAADKLREQLLDKCFEMGVGFRFQVTTDESGKSAFSIKLDKQHQEDESAQLNGVKVFMDPASASQIKDCQLDYLDEPDGGFILKIKREAEAEEDKSGYQEASDDNGDRAG